MVAQDGGRIIFDTISESSLIFDTQDALKLKIIFDTLSSLIFDTLLSSIRYVIFDM
jgi:hypothetical protein